MSKADLSETKRVQLEMESFEIQLPNRLEAPICDYKLVKNFSPNQSTTITIYREQMPGLIRMLQEALDDD